MFRSEKLTIERITVNYEDDSGFPQSSRVRSSNDEIKDIKPGTSMSLEVEIENLFDKDSNLRLDVDATIDCPRDLEVYDDTDSVVVYEDDQNYAVFDIEFEEDEVTDTTYTCTITVSAKDDNQAEHSESWDIRFKVEKERYEISIRDFILSPSTLACNENSFTGNVLIKNTGSYSDNKVKLEITLPKLNIIEEYSNIDLDETDDIRRIVQIRLPENTKPGTYEVIAKTYARGTILSKTETKTITVPNCNPVEPEPVQPQEPVVIIQPPQQETEQVVVEPVTEGNVSQKDTSAVVGKAWIIFFVVLIILLIAAIIGLLVYLFRA
jgi:hypothetical protein